MTTPICPLNSSVTEPQGLTDELAALIHGVAWLGELNRDDVEALLGNSEILTLKGREWLFHQDAPAHWLYIVIDGAIRLTRSVGDSRLVTIRCVGRGGSLGELSLTSPASVHLFSAEALCQSRILAMPTARCRQLLKRKPQSHVQLMHRLTLNLTEHLVDMALLSQADALSRVADYILRQLPPGPVLFPVTVTLPLPKRWLAKQLGMAPETLSRLLAKLREAGAIDGYGHQLKVMDRNILNGMSLPYE